VGAWLALVAENEAVGTVGGVLAVAAAALLLAALALRLAVLVPAAVGLLGLSYALSLLVDGGGLDTRAPFVAAALFAVAELAYWTLELRDAVADEPGAVLRRVSLVAGLAVLVVGLGLVLLTVVELVDAGGRGVELLGVLAAVAALALLALAARRGGAGAA
jgi:hypothetical protein